MPLSRYFGVVLGLAAALSLTVSGQLIDAGTVLGAARAALGGEKKLSDVKTFVATGRTRQIRGNNLVPIEFEINCELPDRFVRTDQIPAQDTDPTVTGFNGDELIQVPPLSTGRGVGAAPGPGGRAAGPPPANAGGRGGAPSPDGGRAGPPLTPAQQRVVAVKQDFARLTLGMFATSFASYPLTFKYAAQGEAPEGKADILEVAGPANFSARLVVQRETHLPVILIWQEPATNVVPRRRQTRLRLRKSVIGTRPRWRTCGARHSRRPSRSNTECTTPTFATSTG
jgi:hypothetical protein